MMYRKITFNLQLLRTIKKERETKVFVVTIGTRIIKTKEKKSEVNIGANLNVSIFIILIKIKATLSCF